MEENIFYTWFLDNGGAWKDLDTYIEPTGRIYLYTYSTHTYNKWKRSLGLEKASFCCSKYGIYMLSTYIYVCPYLYKITKMFRISKCTT